MLMSWQIKRPLKNEGSWSKQARSREEQGRPLGQGQAQAGREGGTEAALAVRQTRLDCRSP